MAFIVKTASKIRNNWKKSTFAAIVFSYGYSWTKDHFETQNLMREYCIKAAEFGRQTIPVERSPKTVTIILNPNANKRSASDDFEKYCAPILHLAGLMVNIIKTESEGHAKKLVEDLNNTDCIVVAGGDGTLSEVITGLLRRTEENTSGLVPIGILPLGRNNSIASILFPGGNKLEKVRSLVDASMAIVEEATKPVDVMKIEINDPENEGDSKPIYALSSFKWGAFRDAEVKKDKYWYYGRFRNYVTYIFNGYKSDLTWKINAEINYTAPCIGCSNCLAKKSVNVNQKWFSRFQKVEVNPLTKTLNPDCITQHQKDVETSDIVISTPNLSNIKGDVPKLSMDIGLKSLDYLTFVRQGWRTVKKLKRDVEEELNARVIEIKPAKVEGKDAYFSIDNEDFEVKPIRITLIPNLITMFCKNKI